MPLLCLKPQEISKIKLARVLTYFSRFIYFVGDDLGSQLLHRRTFTLTSTLSPFWTEAISEKWDAVFLEGHIWIAYYWSPSCGRLLMIFKAQVRLKIVAQFSELRSDFVGLTSLHSAFSTMAGQKFEYDESGSTFYYFLLCFLGLVLGPASYFYFIKDDKKGK